MTTKAPRASRKDAKEKYAVAFSMWQKEPYTIREMVEHMKELNASQALPYFMKRAGVFVIAPTQDGEEQKYIVSQGLTFKTAFIMYSRERRKANQECVLKKKLLAEREQRIADKASEVVEQVRIPLGSGLEMYSSEMLLEELGRRGYIGTLEYVARTTIKVGG